MSRQTMMYVGLFLAGVILAGRVRTMPVLNKLPDL